MSFSFQAKPLSTWNDRFWIVTRTHLDDVCEAIIKKNEWESASHRKVLETYRYRTANGYIAHPARMSDHETFVRLESHEAKILGVGRLAVSVEDLKIMAAQDRPHSIMTFFAQVWQEFTHPKRFVLATQLLRDIPPFGHNAADALFEGRYREAQEAWKTVKGFDREEGYITDFRNRMFGLSNEKIIFEKDKYEALRSMVMKRLDGRLRDCGSALYALYDEIGWLKQEQMHNGIIYYSMTHNELLTAYDSTVGLDWQEAFIARRFGQKMADQCLKEPLERLQRIFSPLRAPHPEP